MIAMVVVATPVLAAAVLAAVFLKAEAMRFENAPITSFGICVDARVGESKGGAEVQKCANDSSVVLKWAEVDELTSNDITEEEVPTSVGASYHSVALIPQLSIWPMTDPEEIFYAFLGDTGEVYESSPVSQITRLRPGYNSRGSMDQADRSRAKITQVQRTLNHQVLLLTGGAVLLISLVGGVVWVAMGRVLRPVEAIRREMADITEHDLSRRVPVPRARNEIAALATTVNATLDRLEVAVEDNRRFVADVSHELRSPIAALRAELEIATAHPDLADWPAVVDAALADTDRLQQLATDLLLLARLDHAGPATGCDATVGLVTLVVEHTARRHTTHTLTTDLPDDPTPVHGSRALLNRLLGNLLDNAERHATTTITIRLTTADDHAVLEVHDDGPGIPAEDRERVFNRFTRLDDARTRDTGGTGLGLPIARRIATAHRGTLHATANPDTPGARLITTLPLQHTTPRSPPTAESSTA
ncbi:HAMP domain-containing histidine kinase [Saccharothrix sp. SC076]|nr:HAMP domain-containing histidine kinase [Saccharothrix obliqua]